MNFLENTHYLLSAKLLREKVPSFEEYPFNLEVVRNFESLEFHPKVTFIIGENGSGKSTLLEAIATAWGFNPEGGTKNFNFATRSSHSYLHEYFRLVKSFRKAKDGFFLRAESFYNVASNIDQLDEEPAFGPPIKNSYGRKSLHHQSHGESFFSLMTHRFGGNGLYILDEPEAALSPTRQMAMLSRIHQLAEQDSQFIIATHSPIILAYPQARIYEIRNGILYTREYTQTEHYSITKSFLNHYQEMTNQLLK
ncbi:MAG TPA: AAA family ATPase [Cellvibrio sp.]|nr:AAA family ATPase [Cellvibrio sp.]